MGKQQKRDANAAERASLAVALRRQKLGYEEIAARCGYGNRGTAYNAVQRELQRIVVDNVEELRREESAMLDALQAEIWPLAMDRSNKARLFAVDRLLAISERRCRLFGLDMRPEDSVTQQHYVKKVILTHETSITEIAS